MPRLVWLSVREFNWWKGKDGQGGNRDRKDEKERKGGGEKEGGEKVVVLDTDAPGGSHNDAITKVGIGENAPRHPHLLALPIERKPFFPGLVQAVNITSPKVFEAISAVKQDYGHYYIGW
jgi:hypothetical protein